MLLGGFLPGVQRGRLASLGVHRDISKSDSAGPCRRGARWCGASQPGAPRRLPVPDPRSHPLGPRPGGGWTRRVDSEVPEGRGGTGQESLDP